jgi:hypothetical protein
MWQSGRKGKGRGREGKGRKGRSKRAALLRWRGGGGVRQSAIMTLLLVVSKIRFYSEVGAEWSILRFWKSSTFPLVVVLVVLMEEHGQNCLLRTESRNLVIFQPRIEVGCQVHLGRCFSAPYVCLWGSGGPVRCVTPPFVGLDVQINRCEPPPRPTASQLNGVLSLPGVRAGAGARYAGFGIHGGCLVDGARLGAVCVKIR